MVEYFRLRGVPFVFVSDVLDVLLSDVVDEEEEEAVEEGWDIVEVVEGLVRVVGINGMEVEDGGEVTVEEEGEESSSVVSSPTLNLLPFSLTNSSSPLSVSSAMTSSTVMLSARSVVLGHSDIALEFSWKALCPA